MSNEDDYSVSVKRWAWMFNAFQDIKHQKIEVDSLLKHHHATFFKSFFERVSSPDIAKSYDYNLRQFLFDQCKEKGLV